MEFASRDGGGHAKYNGVGLVEISKIVVTQGEEFFGTEPLDIAK